MFLITMQVMFSLRAIMCVHMCCSTQLMDLPAFLAQLRTLYSMDDATACNGRRRPDDVETYNNVICFVVSGSLKYRIEKLGTERGIDCATDGQRTLRQIVLQHPWAETIQDHRERPVWANGAFIYCNPQHAKLVQAEHEHFPFPLQSKHIIRSRCSRSHFWDSL